MKLSEIRINPKNPRFIRNEMFQKLLESLKTFPKMMELRPIIVDEQNVIQGGNMRYRALKELGYKDIPESWVKQGKDLTPEQWREFVVKDNLAYGEWDMDLLSAEYDMEELSGWGLELPEEMFEKEQQDIQDDHYEIPERIDTEIQRGDLLTIGPHRLMCGDATKQADVQALMAGRHADLVITDPPYNVSYGSKNEFLNASDGGHRAESPILNDDMSDREFFNFLYDFYLQMLGSLKEGGSFYIFHTDKEGYNFRKALLENGITPRQCLVWAKDTLVLGRQDYQWRHEPILYGWKPGAAHYFTEDRSLTTVIDKDLNISKLTKDEMRKLLEQILDRKNHATVIYADRPKRNDLHPTMKPVTLVGYLMHNSSKPGETVLDPFTGSGSTMVAAHQLKRRCFAIELDPVYCEVIVDRMQKLQPDITIERNGQPYRKNIKETAAA